MERVGIGNMALYCEDDNFSDKRRLRTSAAWEYFEIKNEEKKIANCTLCQTLFSYKSTVSNLMKHLRRKHNIGICKTSDDEEENDENYDTDIEGIISKKTDPRLMTPRSAVWSFFKRSNPVSRLATCLICNRTLSHHYTTSNLRRHLYKKHPNIKLPDTDNDRKRIILSTGDQLFELETTPKNENDDEDNQNEPLEMDEVYLEDFDENVERVEEKVENKFKKHKIFNTRPKRHTVHEQTPDLTESDSSKEEQTYQKRYIKKPDSLDYFGKYITSLLKQLPKQLSNQLQMDFVKQIMNAQLTYEAQTSAQKSVNNSYSITITSEPQASSTVVPDESTVPNVSEDVNQYEVTVQNEEGEG